MKISSYLNYLIAIAITLSFPLSIKAQSKTDQPLGNIQHRLSSPWSNAVLNRSLESTTSINAIQFSPDGQLLASVGASQISIWQLERGEIQRVLPGHYASDIKMEIAPTAIAFSSDSTFLATATWSQGLLNPDQAIIIRNVSTGEVVLNLQESNGCRQVLFNISGDIIYGACGAGVTAWSFPEGKKLFSFDTQHPVDAIALSPDGQVMATVDGRATVRQQGEQSNQIQLWQLNTPQPQLIKTLQGHDNDIAQLEFSSHGQRLVSSSYDGKINIWHWQQGTIDRHTNNLYSDNGVFSLSANGQLIAGNFHSSTITSLVTGLPLRNTLKLGKSSAQIMAFSPQTQLFARVQNRVDSNSLIDLWTVDNSLPKKQPSIRDNYQVIPVSKYWINQEQLQPIPVTQPQIEKPVSIGKDPQEIALSGLGLKATGESASEQVEVDYPRDNLATVSITQTNLGDDSIAAIRYLVEFAPYDAAQEKKWQITWVGEQFKCQPGRGNQDWSQDSCL